MNTSSLSKSEILIKHQSFNCYSNDEKLHLVAMRKHYYDTVIYSGREFVCDYLFMILAQINTPVKEYADCLNKIAMLIRSFGDDDAALKAFLAAKGYRLCPEFHSPYMSCRVTLCDSMVTVLPKHG